MNTLLAPQRRDEPYQRDDLVSDTLRLSSRNTRTTVLDRVALRVGLRLLLWSTRNPRLADDRHRHALARRHLEANAQSARAHQREALLLAPRQ